MKEKIWSGWVVLDELKLYKRALSTEEICRAAGYYYSVKGYCYTGPLTDTDMDGLYDFEDPDDDNDSCEDEMDDFPFDPSQTSDICNNPDRIIPFTLTCAGFNGECNNTAEEEFDYRTPLEGETENLFDNDDSTFFGFSGGVSVYTFEFSLPFEREIGEITLTNGHGTDSVNGMDDRCSYITGGEIQGFNGEFFEPMAYIDNPQAEKVLNLKFRHINLSNLRLVVYGTGGESFNFACSPVLSGFEIKKGEPYIDPAYVPPNFSNFITLAAWDFETSDGTFTDLSGNGNEGILINSPLIIPGLKGNALELSGIDQFAEAFNNNNSLSIPDKLTIEALIKPYSVDGSHIIVSKDKASFGDNYYLEIFNGKIAFGFSPEMQDSLTETIETEIPVIEPDKWYYIVASFKYETDEKPLIFVNGAPQPLTDWLGTGFHTYSAVTFPDNIYIGRSISDGDFFEGIIDDIRIYHNHYSEIPVLTDSDGDGLSDTLDPMPFDANEQADMDKDGIGDNSDPDIDGDGYNNNIDIFPNNSTEWADINGNGCYFTNILTQKNILKNKRD